MASQWVDKDEQLVRLVGKHGHQWKFITELLDASSTSATRNRFLRIEKGRRLKKGLQKCRLCGMRRRGHMYSECAARRSAKDAESRPTESRPTDVTAGEVLPVRRPEMKGLFDEGELESPPPESLPTGDRRKSGRAVRVDYASLNETNSNELDPEECSDVGDLNDLFDENIVAFVRQQEEEMESSVGTEVIGTDVEENMDGSYEARLMMSNIEVIDNLSLYHLMEFNWL